MAVLAPGTNILGVVLFVASFLMATVIGSLTGGLSTGAMTIAGGVMVAATDLAYRCWWKRARLWDRKHGATFLFIPIWIFGLFWIGLGVFYVIRGES